MELQCQECGHVARYNVNTLEPRCSKCRGYDLDLPQTTETEKVWGVRCGCVNGDAPGHQCWD
jgi:Zn finger protein HypA/HybF involved in hydrogenase expression